MNQKIGHPGVLKPAEHHCPWTACAVSFRFHVISVFGVGYRRNMPEHYNTPTLPTVCVFLYSRVSTCHQETMTVSAMAHRHIMLLYRSNNVIMSIYVPLTFH